MLLSESCSSCTPWLSTQCRAVKDGLGKLWPQMIRFLSDRCILSCWAVLCRRQRATLLQLAALKQH